MPFNEVFPPPKQERRGEEQATLTGQSVHLCVADINTLWATCDMVVASIMMMVRGVGFG